MEDFDKRAFNELAEKLAEQQMILEQAGVPGFYRTFNPAEVETQAQIISMIQVRKCDVRTNLEGSC